MVSAWRGLEDSKLFGEVEGWGAHSVLGPQLQAAS